MTSLEFEAVIDREGKITVPQGVLEKFRRKHPVPVHVWLTDRSMSEALRARNVTEEEISRIAALQFESRGQVVSFLLSEGALGRPGKPPRLGGKKR